MPNETKEERYAKKMTKLGFIRRCYWVHPDDIPHVIEHLAKLRDKRLKSTKAGV